MPDSLVVVEQVGKKFCRRLRRSLWYGIVDLCGELVGRRNSDRDLRKEEFWAVRDVSLKLHRGETLGLIGPNGAGKTTLLRMLNGLIKPDRGRIEVRGRMQALIALGAGFNPILTGRENVFINAAVLGLPKSEVERRFDEIVDFSGVREFIDAPVQSYSSGMAVRLGFAVAAHMDPDVLLVDEVLAVGDEGFQSKCLNKIGELRKNGTGIILVSHNMHTISTYANKVLLLDRGKPTRYDNAAHGVSAYRRLFIRQEDMDVQKICTGNAAIRFHHASVNKREFFPGDDFSLTLGYESLVEYRDVEVDVGIYSNREPFFHFQATNKAYGREIHLLKGTHAFTIVIENIRIHDALARIAIAVWAKDRAELLFWWRIPVAFSGIAHATGNSFLNVSFTAGEAVTDGTRLS